jgi:hypothetical protein
VTARRSLGEHRAIQGLAGAGFVLTLIAGLEIAREASGTGPWLGRFSTDWLIALVLLGIPLGAAAVVSAALVFRPDRYDKGLLDRWESWIGAHRWARVGIWIAAPALLPGVFLATPAGWLGVVGGRVWLALLASAALALALPEDWGGRSKRFAVASLGVGSVFVLARRIALVTDYPFALSWSEGNRLWDYSLYFARARYSVVGAYQDPTYLAPGRHGLWGLPFLIPGISIVAVRAWDAALWTLPYLLLGVLVWKGTKGLDRSIGITLALWVFLFLSQGPIYAPLILSAVLVVWAQGSSRPARRAAAAGLAGLYAGLSRWTWAVAPAAWAGLASLLAAPGRSSITRRFVQAAALGAAGLVGAAASQFMMARLNPSPDPIFATALRQPLLWYRLLPSPTNPLGILPGLLLAVGPWVACFVWTVRNRILVLDRLQRIGLACVGAGFLSVGLVASVKIGGGSNLHNLDMLLVTMAILPALIGDRVARVIAALSRRFRFWLGLALVVPVFHAVAAGAPLELPDPGVTRDSLHSLRSLVEREAVKGEVLFIDQRQLFTFGGMPGVPLVMDYELKDLMNQAMGNHRAYLDRFEADLAAHRFRLIVSDALTTTLQGSAHEFGEENDAWVLHAAQPILKTYEPILKLDAVGVWILAPRP